MYSTDMSVPAKAQAVGLLTGSLILSGSNDVTSHTCNMVKEVLQADVACKLGLLQLIVHTHTHTHSRIPDLACKLRRLNVQACGGGPLLSGQWR